MTNMHVRPPNKNPDIDKLVKKEEQLILFFTENPS